MKILGSIFMGTMILSLISAGSKDKNPIKGINPGDLAPEIEMQDNVKAITFDSNKERYTLLSFWTVSDANSRVKNIKMCNKVRQIDAEKIKMYSVSFEKNNSVYAETIKIDQLNDIVNWQDTLGVNSIVYKDYQLDKGFGNYLINGEGMIVAKNVSPENLTNLMDKYSN